MSTHPSNQTASSPAPQGQPRSGHGRLCRQLLLAAAAASLSLGAQACGKWDFGCHIKKVVNDIAGAVTQTVNTASIATTAVVYTIADAEKTLVDFGYSASALGQSGLQQTVGLLNTLSQLKKTAQQDSTKVTKALNAKIDQQTYCKQNRMTEDACPRNWQADFDKQINALKAQATQSAAALAAAEQSLALQVATVAQREFDEASATVASTEKATLIKGTKLIGALKKIESTGLDFVQSGFNAYLAQLQSTAIRSLAKQALGEHTAFLQGLAKAQSLDADGQAALNRLQRAMPVSFNQKGVVTAQTQQDMLQVAVKLGLVSMDGITAPKLKAPSDKSSITIFISGNAAWIGGAAVATGFAMNLYPEADGSYMVAAVESVGGSVGWQAGASAQFGIAWSPDAVTKSVGPSLGVGIDAGVPSVSGAISVAWDPARLVNAWNLRSMTWNGNPMPTMALAIGMGPSVTPVSAAVQGGYTFLVAKQ